VYLSVGDAADGDNTTPLQSGVLRMTANVVMPLTCVVTGGMPPPSVDIFLKGVNITDQVCRPFRDSVFTAARSPLLSVKCRPAGMRASAGC